MRLHFRFVGGPHDGKTIAVPSPVTLGMEVSVRPEEPYLPCAQYVLGEDGFFHHAGGTRGDNANASLPDDEECCPVA